MIAHLKGTLIDKAPNRVVLDAGGVGYGVTVARGVNIGRPVNVGHPVSIGYPIGIEVPFQRQRPRPRRLRPEGNLHCRRDDSRRHRAGAECAVRQDVAHTQ